MEIQRGTGAVERSVRFLAEYGSGVRFGVHNNSLVNLVRGVAERVMYLATPDGLVTRRSPQPGVFRRLSGIRRRLLKCLFPTTVVPRSEYPELYSGRKRGIYERAVASLETRGVRKSDSYVSTFVKAEKINFDAKGDPAPRVIQPRTPRYNVEVGRYLKPFEKVLYRGFSRAFGYDVILKGMNACATATALRSHFDSFTDCVAVGLDASRFDQHVSVDCLQFEHSIYNSVFRSQELAELLSWQLRNRGFGRAADGSIKYEVDGCRMSGDINTSMGNCLIMSCLVLNYFDENGIQAKLANNGDDCVVFLARRDLQKLDAISEYFSEFGFKLTIEAPVDVFEKVEFCQTRPVWTESGWRMVRDIRTAPSKDCVSLLGWDCEANFSTWRDAIGSCGLELTRGVPMWEAFYTRLLTGQNRRGGLENTYDSGMGYMARGVVGCEITPQARYSFWRAFGVLPDEQIAYEQELIGIEWCQPTPVMFADILPTTSLPWLSHAAVAQR